MRSPKNCGIYFLLQLRRWLCAFTKVTDTAVTLARSNDELQEAVKNVEASGRKAATGIVRILIFRMRLNSMWAKIMSLGLT